MALNKRERAATAAELAANLGLAGLDEARLQKALGLTDDQLEAALDASGDPIDVWLVRDYLDRVILDRGATPLPYSALTPAARASAQKWLALYDVDDVLKDSAG